MTCHTTDSCPPTPPTPLSAHLQRLEWLGVDVQREQEAREPRAQLMRDGLRAHEGEEHVEGEAPRQSMDRLRACMRITHNTDPKHLRQAMQTHHWSPCTHSAVNSPPANPHLVVAPRA